MEITLATISLKKSLRVAAPRDFVCVLIFSYPLAKHIITYAIRCCKYATVWIIYLFLLYNNL